MKCVDDSDANGHQKKKVKDPVDEEMGGGFNDSQGEITEEDIVEVKDGKLLTPTGTICCRWLSKLSELDRHFSEKIQRSNNRCIEAIFLCIPAHMFNRIIILVPMGISLILGSLYYDHMLKVNHYKKAGHKAEDTKRLGFGFCFFMLYSITLLLMVCCT